MPLAGVVQERGELSTTIMMCHCKQVEVEFQITNCVSDVI